MKLQILASGSSGNAYLLITSKSKILLECGIRFKEIQKKLAFNLDIDGCLLTHNHFDHSKAVKDILKQGIDTYTSEGTANALELEHHRLHIVKGSKQFKINELIILPFDLEHDAEEPLGFMIYDTITKEKLVFATDTYYIKYQFPKVNYYVIECNYDKDLLEKNIEEGFISVNARQRLLTSHMNLENLIKYFKSIDISEVMKIVLIHSSSDNSDDYFKQRIEDEIGVDTEIADNQTIDLIICPF